MKCTSCEYRSKSARRGAQFVFIGIPTVCCKTHPPNIATSLPIKDTSRLMISVSDNFLVESEWFI